MINSVNALEFLKPKLLTMDKYNSTKTTKLLPPSSLTQTRTFVTISDRQHHSTIDPLQEKQTQFLLNNEVKDHDRVRVQHLENHTKLQNNKCWNNFRTFYNISASSSDRSGKEMFQIRQKSEDNEIDVVNVEQLTSTTTTTTSPLDIQNKSAFNLDLNNKYPNNNGIVGNNDYNNLQTIDSTKFVETNNNYKFYCNYKLINNKQIHPTSMIMMSTIPQATTNTFSYRTEDQNHAYRHIESVHNYAKSKSYEGEDDNNASPNGNHHNSLLDDDEDDDDDDEDENDDDDDDADYDNDDDINYEDRLKLKIDESLDDLDADYEDIFSKRRYRRFQKYSTLSDAALSTKTDKIMNHKGATHFVNILKDHKIQSGNVNKKFKESKEEDDIQIDVDVETVESQSSPTIIPVLDTNSLMTIGDSSSAFVKPDHHARRPMNAFLIFCKRHRAIVKERYKNLENRAITKILGDWWASLDTSDKKCFTSLAQQNKDAFFSANPNFKWYKLPAPPLRTLTTRPATAFGQEYHEENETAGHEMINNNHSNYFKFADEAQMGDLSQLMQDKSKTTKQCADLQQILGETSQFMSAHITGNSETLEENHLKRRFYSENSFSSNSSEEDGGVESKKRNVRSCKGKRYQELINSGQIATALKKSKSSIRAVSGDDGRDNSEINTRQNFSIVNGFRSNLSNNTGCDKGSACESENMLSYDLNGFDLEEKIKELPALNLDDYLLRKRCTKKKKKFSSNGKKRGQRSNANNYNSDNITNGNAKDNLTVKTSQDPVVASLSNESLEQQPQQPKHQQQAATAVGSQKRKARKESITRRDVSAMEQEAASLLPLTINGCCYFQEAPTSVKYIKTSEKDIEEKSVTPQLPDITSTSPIIPSTQNSSSSVSIDILSKNNNNYNNNNNNNNISNILNDNIASSTSDLLILAEVAANRTELKH